jgi:glycosyltransferase involved in cell wall biosynthesis
MNADVPVVTILTPAYNRADTLPRLYESLLAQTVDGIEWVVVDDGSKDGTEALVAQWITAGRVPIRYLRQENGGKHVAVNRGVELARGEYTAVVDSDDRLTPDAVEVLLDHWGGIPEDDRPRFSGVVGLCSYDDGRIVGDPYPIDPLDCDPAELTYVHRVSGDKLGLLRTEVLREYPFPFEEVRGYVTEALVWNRMALRYTERHVNDVVLLKEYREGGISDRALELLVAAAPATRQFFLEEARLPHAMPLRSRARSHANYVRYSLHAGVGVRRQLAEAPSRAAWIVAFPVGTFLFLRDRRRLGAGQPSRDD